MLVSPVSNTNKNSFDAFFSIDCKMFTNKTETAFKCMTASFSFIVVNKRFVFHYETCPEMGNLSRNVRFVQKCEICLDKSGAINQ